MNKYNQELNTMQTIDKLGKFIKFITFMILWLLATKLIEYKGELWVDTAGDLFGTIALMVMGWFIYSDDKE